MSDVKYSNQILVIGGLKGQVSRIKKATAFNDEERIVYAVDGLKLDAYTVSATLLSWEDFDDMIKMLQISQKCFWNPKAPHGY